MKAQYFSAMAAALSASCALLTVYLNRSVGKGFVWVKDQKIGLIANPEGKIHIQIELPIFNLGKGRIRFISLRAKKINLHNKATELFEIDMDEAYFSEMSYILAYRVAIHTELPVTSEATNLFLASGGAPPSDPQSVKDYQDKINKKIGEVPEHIIILKCKYRDGSFLGLRTVTTIIGLSVRGMEVNYLSTARRKELNQFFAW